MGAPRSENVRRAHEGARGPESQQRLPRMTTLVEFPIRVGDFTTKWKDSVLLLLSIGGSEGCHVPHLLASLHFGFTSPRDQPRPARLGCRRFLRRALRHL